MIKVFEENGYHREDLLKMAHEVKSKNTNEPINNVEIRNDNESNATITLPWIPGVSPRLKKVYRKTGYKVVFRSGKNIGNILTSKNKTKLPKNSHPGVYKIPCSCGITAYRGETKKRISTRLNEHKNNIDKEEWEKSAVALHSKECNGRIEFENAKTVAIINNKFERKVRETLEIQKHDCHKDDGGMNQDKGHYVTTKFWYPMLKYVKKNEEKELRHSRENNVTYLTSSDNNEALIT